MKKRSTIGAQSSQTLPLKKLPQHLKSMKRMKITPDDFIKMNEEFEREGTAFRVIVPTQDQIDNPTGVVLDLYSPQPPMPKGPWGAKLNISD